MRGAPPYAQDAAMSAGTGIDSDAFNAFEAAGWEARAESYHRHLGAMTAPVIEPLLDAAGVARGRRVLDVATGPGYAAAACAVRGASVVGVDVAGAMVALARRLRPELEFRQADAERLPFGDGEFDTVTAIEALEHVEDPEAVLAEMARVGRSHLLASVPREPLWRALNLARGAYVRRLGDTPGHRHHWSRQAFVRLLARHGEIARVRSPLPWTVVLVRLVPVPA
jgi:2-polyprenyl-3-methyl-5-hydroxy-6-metoxy-1,4-benzoquinol methylase